MRLFLVEKAVQVGEDNVEQEGLYVWRNMWVRSRISIAVEKQ